MHDAAVVDDKVARAEGVLPAADEIFPLAADRQNDLGKVLMRMHDARMGAVVFVYAADGEQAHFPHAEGRRAAVCFDKTLDHSHASFLPDTFSAYR